jgi:hypothetical protein
MRHDRTVIGYHGCDASVAERLLAGDAFKPSDNDFDWLGRGVYFWEYGADRALRFAQEQQARGKVRVPVVVGAVLQLGRCFDLLDTRFTRDLAADYSSWEAIMRDAGAPLPTNAGAAPDHKLRRLDCAVLNWVLDTRAVGARISYDSVRGGFTEGTAVFLGSGIQTETHVQVAIRNHECILGMFRPTHAERFR